MTNHQHLPPGDPAPPIAKRVTAIDAHVGRRLRLRRQLLGVSQEQLAGALGISFQQVQKYERGINRVGAARLLRLSEVLAVPLAYFFEDLPGAPGAPATADDLADRSTVALVRDLQRLSADCRAALIGLARALIAEAELRAGTRPLPKSESG